MDCVDDVYIWAMVNKPMVESKVDTGIAKENFKYLYFLLFNSFLKKYIYKPMVESKVDTGHWHSEGNF